MRTHNVEAFVYPSARADVTVDLIDGEIRDHRGWNLVDYRGAPLPAIDVSLDMSLFNAPTTLPEGVQIVLPPKDEASLRGSFAVKGLAAWHMMRLNRQGATGVLDLV